MHQAVFDKIEDAAAYAEKISSSRDVYFATHVLVDGKLRRKLRAQENARASKVLFLDLDVDPAKPTKYATLAEAVGALVKFVTDTKLPQPMVVSSGGGLHVYWVLEQELDSHGEWLTLAKRLKHLALSHQLKIDLARTTDQASLLRVAGTWNLKGGAKRPVEVRKLGQIATPTLPSESEDSGVVAGETAPTVAGLGSNTGQAEFDKPPPTMVSLLKSCAQMQRLARLFKTGGTEPEWYWGGIGVVKFTENGRANCHKISAANPHYSVVDTDAKIDQWAMPPTTCKKLEEVCGPENAHLCQGCPAFGKGSSPAWIAVLNDHAPPPVLEPVNGVEYAHGIPNPPLPYMRPRTGGIEILLENKEGKTYPFPIYPYDLYPVERSANSQHETEQQIWRIHPPHAEARNFTIEASTFVDDRALQARLANNGIYPPRFSDMKNYMSAYVRELHRLNPVSVQYNQLGWVTEHTEFVLPDKILQPVGAPKPATLSTVAANAKTFVGTRGTLAAQVELMKFFNHPSYIPHQFFILSSLGAAIFFATGHHGVIINATGKPGASKSTSLYAAASFWGPPKRFTLSGTNEGATALARGARRDILSSLPFCLDEITHIAADVAKNFAMHTTQPGSRLRLKRDGSQMLQTDNERAAMTLTTANKSLHSLLQVDNSAGTAGSVRVFEIMFEQLVVHKPYEADAFLRGIVENYGWIGEVFIQAVVRARDKVIARVVEVMKRLGIAANAQPEERFWFAAVAANLVAGDLACRLGLLSWDIPLIEAWVVNEQLPHMRGIVQEEVQSTSPASVLMDYLQHINGDMIKMTKHQGNIANVIQAPRGQLLAHYDMDKQLIDVLKSNFREWCWRHSQHSSRVLGALGKTGVVPFTSAQRVMGRGSSHSMGRSSCFVVDMKHPDIADTQLPTVPHSLTVIAGGKQ